MLRRAFHWKIRDVFECDHSHDNSSSGIRVQQISTAGIRTHCTTVAAQAEDKRPALLLDNSYALKFLTIPYGERMIGSIRRDRLDGVMILCGFMGMMGVIDGLASNTPGR
jgi:hypothetical protein